MGLLGRSRSLKRKPSTLSKTRSEDEPYGGERRPSEVVVNVKQEFDVRSTHLDLMEAARHAQRATSSKQNQLQARSQNVPRPATRERPPECSEDLERTGQTIEYKSDDLVFRFPTPSPSPSPRLPKHRFEVSNSDASIGIALGSPRLQPPQYLESPKNSPRELSPRDIPNAARLRKPPPAPIRTASEPIFADHSNSPPRELKKQKSGLRGIFGRKPSKRADTDPPARFNPPVPASYWSPTVPSKDARYAEYQRPLHSNLSASRLPMQERRPSATEVKTRENARAPLQAKAANMRSEKLDSSPRKQAIQNSQLGNATGPLPVSKFNAASNLLNVEIPEAKMDRYSVMFEKCLKSQPSLLERRHGTLKRLHTVGDDDDLREVAEQATSLRRSATSPRITSRPSPRAALQAPTESSIREATSVRISMIKRPQMIGRSNTAPIDMFGVGSKNGTEGPPTASPGSPVWSEASLPPTPDSAETNHIFSFGHDSSFAKHGVANMTPRYVQPTIESGAGRPTPRRQDSKDPVIKVEDASTPTGQIGIARSVSLSRRRPNQMPITVKQPLRPRVVDTGNRKSTLVMIEHTEQS